MNKKNILYPVCAESFKKWYLSNDKYKKIYLNLGKLELFDVTLRDGLQGLTKEEQDTIIEDSNNKKSFGIHIHCPDGATPKDGPSAGLAFTLAIYSLLTGKKVNNKICMTGEVDLLGKAHEIGGLYSKLQGALNAGVKKVLIPKDNEKDLDIIFKKEEDEKIDLKKSSSIKKLDSYLLLENNCYKIDPKKRVFRNNLDIYLVNDIFEILEHALVENDIISITEYASTDGSFIPETPTKLGM
jgi:predicted ATP-dependent protease